MTAARVSLCEREREAWEVLATAIENASEHTVTLPVTRTIGAGYAVQQDVMIGITPDAWDEIVNALNALNGYRGVA